jgi:hypothetical protein
VHEEPLLAHLARTIPHDEGVRPWVHHHGTPHGGARLRNPIHKDLSGGQVLAYGVVHHQDETRKFILEFAHP